MGFLHQLNDPDGVRQLIVAGGYLLLFAIIFSETGLLIGFFLPGDSLLFIAGFSAANAVKYNLPISIVPMILVLSFAAIAGDTVGYFIGRQLGPALFSKQDSRLFKRKHLESAHAFYEKHGPKTIVLARFVPIVRTFAPTVAGAARMDYKQFLTYNVVGGISWITSMSLLGYFLGSRIPAKYLDKVSIVIIFLSLAPMIFHAIKEKKTAKLEAGAISDQEGKPFATK